MLPYLLAVAGGYILGNAFKDDMPSFAEGGVVDPKMLYERLREAEMNFKNDDGAEYYRIQKEISENRKLYFEKLRQAEMNWSKDDGAEYNRLMSMRDSFADGGMMAKGGWIMDNDGEKNVIDDSKYKEYIKRFKSSDSWKQTQDSPNVKVFESGTSKTKFTKIK